MHGGPSLRQKGKKKHLVRGYDYVMHYGCRHDCNPDNIQLEDDRIIVDRHDPESAPPVVNHKLRWVFALFLTEGMAKTASRAAEVVLP